MIWATKHGDVLDSQENAMSTQHPRKDGTKMSENIVQNVR